MDELDRILSREETVTPSAGFVTSVMAAVRREAAAPPPIPFPWRRLLTGLSVCVVLGLAGTLLHVLSGSPVFAPAVPWTAPFRDSVLRGASIWVLLALLTSLITVRWSLRLTGYRS